MMVAFNVAEQIAWDPRAARPAIERLLTSDEVGLILVADDPLTSAVTRGGAGLAGYTVVTWGFDLEHGGRDAMLTELFVDPVYRRHHLGTALVETAMTRAAEC